VHPIYNLKFSVKENDVWYSDDGARWVNLVNMTGDFYLQNKDVIQVHTPSTTITTTTITTTTVPVIPPLATLLTRH
jgi:hypothetical protein